jgi:NAD(P)-dependent dehydrogenase (short-subunit alcohol dehydrogenase family)
LTSLKGHIALVTGGSKGIGRSIALAFAGEGADVAICARHLDELERVSSEIETFGVRALPMECDVTDTDQVHALPAKITNQLGPVDILVNNAGTSGSHKFLGHPDELWNSMIDLNLNSVYHVCKSFVPSMVERESGRIITIGSIRSKVGAPYVAAYTASKHGVLGLMRVLALELIRYDITVNVICPSFVDTPMTDGNVARLMERTGRPAAEIREHMASASPQKRILEPEEIAAVALMLASDQARGITGQAINIDGGMLSY